MAYRKHYRILGKQVYSWLSCSRVQYTILQTMHTLPVWRDHTFVWFSCIQIWDRRCLLIFLTSFQINKIFFMISFMIVFYITLYLNLTYVTVLHVFLYFLAFSHSFLAVSLNCIEVTKHLLFQLFHFIITTFSPNYNLSLILILWEFNAYFKQNQLFLIFFYDTLFSIF